MTEFNLAPARFDSALALARAELLQARTSAGHWEGELSTSALSTATAVTALALCERAGTESLTDLLPLCERGLDWLARNQNADGGWGDTTRSLSNLSTTALVWAAFGALVADEKYRSTVSSAEQWLEQKTGSLEPERLATAIADRYGKDRTFSVPILTMCALAGRLGKPDTAWPLVRQLPFELAALPHEFFAALRLPVVSYALPALIAIGQARHFHCPTSNPFTRAARAITRNRTLQKLEDIQPANGGFLEATPLTSFVVMSLAGSGLADHAVTRRGLEFLVASVRPDGSWPIDTNLGTWITTLSLNALGPSCRDVMPLDERMHLRDWLLGQQTRQQHPYTQAGAGAWAWTDLPGGVPDADDTAGTLLAMQSLGLVDEQVRCAADLGVQWLVSLQNKDGGIPTFCRGWGTLPFDRSGPDLTAHTLRAWLVWRRQVTHYQRRGLNDSIQHALDYLRNTQRPEGTWAPLWFGNQHAAGEENLTYGTARVVTALAAASERGHTRSRPPLSRGVEFLLRAQNTDGSWGANGRGSGTMEETGLAVESLALAHQECLDEQRPRLHVALRLGATWLIQQTQTDAWKEASPIGFYFAKLWYFERLYPILFTVAALERAREVIFARR